jgi:hypothetical protein
VRWPSVEAMESSLSPQEYEEWQWSLEFDPPAADRLGLLLSLIEWRLTFMMAKKEDTVSFAKHRIRWDAEQPQEPPRIIYYESTESDESDVPDDLDSIDESEFEDESLSEVAAVMDAHNDLRAGLGLSDTQPIMPLLPRPNAVPVPAHIFAALTGRSNQTETE